MIAFPQYCCIQDPNAEKETKAIQGRLAIGENYQIEGHLEFNAFCSKPCVACIDGDGLGKQFSFRKFINIKRFLKGGIHSFCAEIVRLGSGVEHRYMAGFALQRVA